jgi:hypothetical protein
MATLSAYLYEKTEDSKRVVFYIFSFLIPLVFISIRYQMGTDYTAYVSIFEKIMAGNGYLSVEPAYLLINLFVVETGLDVQWVFIIMGFLFMLFFYKSLPRNGFALGVFFLMSIYYFQGGYNQIRQGVAIAIMAYAMVHIYEKKLLKFTLLSLLATAFHFPTGVVLFTTYFFANMKTNRFFLIIVVLIAFLIMQQGLLNKLVYHVINTIAPAYSHYLMGHFAEPIESSLGVIAPLIQLFVAISIFFFKERIIEQYPKANIVINLYVLYIVFYLFKFEINIFNRVQYMFVFSFILSLVFFIKTFHIKGRGFILFFVGLLYYLIFLKTIYNGDIYKDKGTKLRPYQTILFDKD